MLVAQSLVLDSVALESVLVQILDSSPYPRTLYLQNQSTSNTLTIKIESSTDGGHTWVQVGDTEIATPGYVVSRFLIGTGPMIRVKSSGIGRIYMGLARFQTVTPAVLTILNL
jgi:hypothetical protein